MENKGPAPKDVPPEQILVLLRKMLYQIEYLERSRREISILIKRCLDLLDSTATERAVVPNRKVFRIRGHRVELPKMLADLVEALTASPGTWMKAEQLTLKLGDNVTARTGHGISQVVYRLRKELKLAGIDGRIIESSRRRGYRWRSADKG